VTTPPRTAAGLEQLDHLVHALERANDALCFGAVEEGDAALADGLNLLGAFYGALSPEISPEASAHLETAYDACLRGLGDAYSGNRQELVSAIGLLRSIRRAVSPTIRIRKAA
jgi:hypothetical protein